MTLVEAAVETLADALRAEREGARRLELCADLQVGGKTPSVALLRRVQAAVRLPIVVMIRPRAGDFTYSEAELQQMLREIAEAAEAGVAGVVFGALSVPIEVDRKQVARLVRAARPMAAVFHRAIDATRDLVGSIEVLADLGINRVLTSGGAPSAEAGIPMLARVIKALGGRIGILPGGRVRAENAERIVEQTGATEVHVGLPVGAEDGRIRAVVRRVGG